MKWVIETMLPYRGATVTSSNQNNAANLWCIINMHTCCGPIIITLTIKTNDFQNCTERRKESILEAYQMCMRNEWLFSFHLTVDR